MDSAVLRHRLGDAIVDGESAMAARSGREWTTDATARALTPPEATETGQ